MPRYTREQVRQRRRVAAAILAVILLIAVVSCAAGASRVLSRSTPAEEDSVPRRSTVRAVPTTAPDAPALSELPEGDGLREGEVLGIDVSSHQGVIDWRSVRADGAAFAYIKATEGMGHVDERLNANWRGAGDAGLVRGAYHYFTLCSPGAEQAESFLAAVPPDASHLPPALDLELDGACDERPEPAVVDVEVGAFVTAVEKAWGRRVVIYSSYDWRDAYGLPTEIARPQWHSREDRRPEGDWDIWQVRFDARIDGVEGPVDLDVMRVDDLRRAAAIAR